MKTKKKKLPRRSYAFRAALDFVTSREPHLDYDARCKKAALVQRIFKAQGVKLKTTQRHERATIISQRKRMHVEAEYVLDRQDYAFHVSDSILLTYGPYINPLNER